MKKVTIIFTIILLMTISHLLIGQEINYIYRVNETFKIEDHKHDYKKFLLESSNEFKVVFSSLFLFYKTFISSQDMNSCVFYPSCSVYAIESISKKGFVLGFMSAMDRLTRCHPFAGLDDHYYYDIKRMKLYDPVD